MKKIIHAALLIIPILLGTYYAVNYRGYKNLKNCERLHVGMSKTEVIDVMGEPDTVLKNYIDRQNKVLYINCQLGLQKISMYF